MPNVMIINIAMEWREYCREGMPGVRHLPYLNDCMDHSSEVFTLEKREYRRQALQPPATFSYISFKFVNIFSRNPPYRDMLRLPLLFSPSLLPQMNPSHAMASSHAGLRVEIPVGSEVPTNLREYFSKAVSVIQEQIGAGFKARLAVYGVTRTLPSGVPGDPSKDFTRERACGSFTSSADRPYALCPEPGRLPIDELSRDCCRHFAFAVPYSRFGLAVADRYSTVVVAPRLASLPDEVWQAILVHELGHVIDFYLYGKRYRLCDNKPSKSASPDLLAALQGINAAKVDPELRADAFGELLLLRSLRKQLCYDGDMLLQTIVGESATCNETLKDNGQPHQNRLLRHYSHAPLQGTINSAR